jgi:hypothetical protein
MSESDRSLSTRIGVDGSIWVTVPASAIDQAKTAELISGRPIPIEVTCIISYLPDSFTGVPDDRSGDIFL